MYLPISDKSWWSIFRVHLQSLLRSQKRYFFLNMDTSWDHTHAREVSNLSHLRHLRMIWDLMAEIYEQLSRKLSSKDNRESFTPGITGTCHSYGAGGCWKGKCDVTRSCRIRGVNAAARSSAYCRTGGNDIWANQNTSGMNCAGWAQDDAEGR